MSHDPGIALRLRGVTTLHAGVAAACAYPFGYLAVRAWVQQRPTPVPLFVLAGVVALLPWLSRAVARTLYRAACDDIALHVGGEALPYRAITQLEVRRSARRVTLHLRRAAVVEIELVLWDAFAGRLEPYDELARRLAAAGHSI